MKREHKGKTKHHSLAKSLHGAHAAPSDLMKFGAGQLRRRHDDSCGLPNHAQKRYNSFDLR